MVKGVQTLGAMAPPGGARNSLDPRLASLFIVFELEAPSLSSLKTIYNSILRAHCKNFAAEVQGVFLFCILLAPFREINLNILPVKEGVKFVLLFITRISKVHTTAATDRWGRNGVRHCL